MFFHFKQKKVHINGLDFRQNAKNLVFQHKCCKISILRFFFENPALSLFLLYCSLTSCKKLEKSLEPFASSFNQILDDASNNMRLQIISRKPDVFGTCDQLESCRPYWVLHSYAISAQSDYAFSFERPKRRFLDRLQIIAREQKFFGTCNQLESCS